MCAAMSSTACAYIERKASSLTYPRCGDARGPQYRSPAGAGEPARGHARPRRPLHRRESRRMLRLLGIVIAIGLADSVNPSTIAPALLLAAGENPRENVSRFTAAVFLV